MRGFFYCLCAALCVGCTALTSDNPLSLDEKGRAPKGAFYSLPRAVNQVKLEVYPSNAVFKITVHQPKYIADPEHKYYLRYKPLPISDDEIDIEIGNKYFVKSIKATVEDRIPQIILKAVGALEPGFDAAGRTEAAVSLGDPITIVDDVVDLTDPKDLIRLESRMNRAAKNFAQTICNLRSQSNGRNDKAVRSPDCSSYDYVRRTSNPIRLRVHHPQSYVPVKPADCSKGICYRPSLPYRITASFSDGGSFSGVVSLPNAAAPVLIDIRRAFAVRKVHEISFNEDTGQLEHLLIEKPSQLEAVAGLPLAVAKAILRVPGELIQFRVGTVQQKRSLVEEKTKLAQARGHLEAAQSGVVAGTTEAAVRGQSASQAKDKVPAPPGGNKKDAAAAEMEPPVLIAWSVQGLVAASVNPNKGELNDDADKKGNNNGNDLGKVDRMNK